MRIGQSKYFCPYSSRLYQFPIQRSDGEFICGQCGDPLVKKAFIRPIQIVSFLAALAFSSPFLVLVFSYIREIETPRQQRNIDITWKIVPLNYSKV